jgi:hypothetical protein
MEVLKQGIPKTRRVYRYHALGPTVAMGIHNNSLQNLRRGILERVFFVEVDGELREPPRPRAGVFSGRLQAVGLRLRRMLPTVTPWGHDQVVDSYTGHRRQIYARAAESLRTKALCKQDAYLKTFVKAEKVNFEAKGDPAPRVIQPRDARYILESARFLKHLEHTIYGALGQLWGGDTVMKGKTPYGVARALREKWDKRTAPVAVGLDASRFDQHVSVDALHWEHGIYLSCYKGGDRKELAKLLRWQIYQRGYARASDGLIKYKVNGCRGSGDINTALGNCLLMCAMVKAYCEEHGIDADLANNGDDCVLVMEAEQLPLLAPLKAWFKDMGFTMKVEDPVFEFEHIEFCQGHPVWTPEGWIMVRNLRTALAKDCLSLLDVRHHARDVFAAVGSCGLAIAGGLPVFNEFYERLRVLGVDGARKLDVANDRWFDSSGFSRMAKGMARCYSEVDPRTRYSFWRAFGVTPDAQYALEQYYKHVSFDMTVRDDPGLSEYPNLVP